MSLLRTGHRLPICSVERELAVHSRGQVRRDCAGAIQQAAGEFDDGKIGGVQLMISRNRREPSYTGFRWAVTFLMRSSLLVLSGLESSLSIVGSFGSASVLSHSASFEPSCVS